MDKGKVVEFAAPKELLKNQNTLLYLMVQFVYA